eukprot:5758212-Pyramimonas_sp.AAC.1
MLGHDNEDLAEGVHCDVVEHVLVVELGEVPVAEARQFNELVNIPAAGEFAALRPVKLHRGRCWVDDAQ